MEITFLGTSQAVPTKDRNQASIFLSHGAENILIDCGEGTQRQMKIARINPCKITRILLTHWHGDHVLGLPGLLQTLALNKYSKTLQVYGPKGTERFFNLLLSLFIFRDSLKVKVNEIDSGIFFENDDFKLEASRMRHQAPCLAYSFIERDKRNIKISQLKKLGITPGPILKKLSNGENIFYKGKRIPASKYTILRKGKKISFIFDTSYNENCFKISKNSDLLIAEACFADQDTILASERGHLTTTQIARIAKTAKVKKLFILHISQRYPNQKIILDEVKKIFKNTELAKDFMKIKI